MKKSEKMAALTAALLLSLTLACLYPVHDDHSGSRFALEERYSVWQYLNIFSIYRDKIPGWPNDETPDGMFKAIGDRFTGYYTIPTGGGGSIPGLPPDTVIKLTESTVYFAFNDFYENNLSLFMAYVDYMSGFQNVIIDLRFNGGGYIHVAYDIIGEFLRNDTEFIYINNRTYDDKKLTGIADEGVKRTTNPHPRLSDKNVAILVSEFSASASELLASALIDGINAENGARNVYLVGGTTYGKARGQSILPRTGTGYRPLRITSMKINGLTDRTGDYNEIGLEPDPTAGNLDIWYETAGIAYILHSFLITSYIELHNDERLLAQYLNYGPLMEYYSDLFYSIKLFEPAFMDYYDVMSLFEPEYTKKFYYTLTLLERPMEWGDDEPEALAAMMKQRSKRRGAAPADAPVLEPIGAFVIVDDPINDFERAE